MSARGAASVTGLGMLVAWALGVTAGEPTGFGGFPWGTPLGVVKEQLRGCASYAVITTVRGNQRYVCEHYDLTRVGDVYLTLEFIDGGLRGYTIAVPQSLSSKLIAAEPEITGVPSSPSHASAGRRWPVSVDISTTNCLPSSTCLIVSTF